VRRIERSFLIIIGYTTSAEWEMPVPDDDHRLAEGFRRRGVRPGARLHVVVSEEAADQEHEVPAYFGSFAASPDLTEGS
jgi:hypothetical protein